MKSIFGITLALSFTFSSLVFSQEHLVQHIGTSAESALVRWELIDEAQKEIVISTHILAGDDMAVNRLFGKLYLKKLQNPDIVIKLLWDDWESSKNIKKPMMEAMEAVGIEMYRFRPKDKLKHLIKLNNRMHDKVFTIDRTWLVAGDKNLSKDYYGLSNNSFIGEEVVVKGPVADQATDHVNDVIKSGAVERVKIKAPLSPEVRRQLLTTPVEKINFGPAMTPEIKNELLTLQRFSKKGIPERFIDNIRDWKSKLRPVKKVEFWHDVVALKGKNFGTAQKGYDLIARTRGRLIVQSPYIVLSPEARMAYAQAADKGAEIIILTNSPMANDMKLVGAAWPTDREFFRSIGATVYELPGPDAQDLKAIAQEERINLVKKLSSGNPQYKNAVFSNPYKWQLRDPKNIVKVENAQHNKMVSATKVAGEHPDDVFVVFQSKNEDIRSEKLNMEVGVKVTDQKIYQEAQEEVFREIERAGYIKTVENKKLLVRLPDRGCIHRAFAVLLRGLL